MAVTRRNERKLTRTHNSRITSHRQVKESLGVGSIGEELLTYYLNYTYQPSARVPAVLAYSVAEKSRLRSLTAGAIDKFYPFNSIKQSGIATVSWFNA